MKFGSSRGGGARRYVVVGCGRLGARLAGRLSVRGDSVVVIDRDPAACDRLPAPFSGFTIEDEAADQEVLRRAKADQADALVAVTTRENVNLMVAQVARAIFGVVDVVARVYDPSAERLYRALGVPTVSPTLLSEEAFLAALGEREPHAGLAAAAEGER